MDEMNLNRAVSETLHACGDGLKAPDKLKTRIDFAIKSGAPQPKRRMRSWKRNAVALCAVLAVAVGGAFAGGKVASWSSNAFIYDGWTDFSKTAPAAQAISPDIKVVDNLLGEFRFVRGNSDATDKIDESGNTVGSFPELSLNYQNDKGATLFFDASPVQADGIYTDALDETREIGGVTVGYRAIPQIYLPGDGSEKPTAEEQAKKDAGEINIAYGTQTREEKTCYRVQWVEGDISYTILTFDENNWTADDFFEMAQSVIAQP